MLIGLEEEEADWGSTSSPSVLFFTLEQGQHKQEAQTKGSCQFVEGVERAGEE